MIEKYIVNERWKDGEMERFRMHPDQRNGCINCDTEGKEGKLEMNC